MEPTGFDWATFWVGLIGSVATVAALVTAIVIGLHEIRAVRRENAVRDAERQEEAARLRRAQAECVSAQLKVHAERARVYNLEEPEQYPSYIDVFNASALPIYEVEVRLTHWDDPDMVMDLSVPFVPGGQTGHVHAPLQPSRDRDGTPVLVRFTDAAGRRWVRHSEGLLHEGFCEEWSEEDAIEAVRRDSRA